MERHLGAALCLVASMGCGSLLGLDDFGDRTTQGTGASAGQGAAGAGASGGSTGANGGTGGEPGGGGLGGMGGGTGGGNGGGSGGGNGGHGGSLPVLKRVFVTSAKMNGWSLGGLVGANMICDSAAPNGNFAAWLSDGATPAPSNLIGTGPWYLVDQTFNPTNSSVGNKADLISSGPFFAITVTESGSLLGGGDTAVWTGTDASGASTGVDCDDWSNSTFSETTGTFGDAGTTGPGWTDDQVTADVPCNGDAHLYCFEI